MAGKKPPYTHREMAKAIFKNPTSAPYKITLIPTWLKIEAYTVFFEVLPHLITLAVWAAIAAVFCGALLLI